MLPLTMLGRCGVVISAAFTASRYKRTSGIRSNKAVAPRNAPEAALTVTTLPPSCHGKTFAVPGQPILLLGEYGNIGPPSILQRPGSLKSFCLLQRPLWVPSHRRTSSRSPWCRQRKTVWNYRPGTCVLPDESDLRIRIPNGFSNLLCLSARGAARHCGGARVTVEPDEPRENGPTLPFRRIPTLS
jgi:hypothetical protein